MVVVPKFHIMIVVDWLVAFQHIPACSVLADVNRWHTSDLDDVLCS